MYTKKLKGLFGGDFKFMGSRLRCGLRIWWGIKVSYFRKFS